MRLTKEKNIVSVEEIGYVCDVCKKEVKYSSILDNSRNTVRWSYPDGYENADICSVSCLLKYLKGVYFGAEVSLSGQFLDDLRIKLEVKNKKTSLSCKDTLNNIDVSNIKTGR